MIPQNHRRLTVLEEIDPSADIGSDQGAAPPLAMSLTRPMDLIAPRDPHEVDLEPVSREVQLELRRDLPPLVLGARQTPVGASELAVPEPDALLVREVEVPGLAPELPLEELLAGDEHDGRDHVEVFPAVVEGVLQQREVAAVRRVEAPVEEEDPVRAAFAQSWGRVAWDVVEDLGALVTGESILNVPLQPSHSKLHMACSSICSAKPLFRLQKPRMNNSCTSSLGYVEGGEILELCRFM